jgi:hypothetical protein
LTKNVGRGASLSIFIITFLLAKAALARDLYRGVWQKKGGIEYRREDTSLCISSLLSNIAIKKEGSPSAYGVLTIGRVWKW